MCEIQYQKTDNISVEVHWYRSRTIQAAGVEGEYLNNMYMVMPNPAQSVDNTTTSMFSQLSITTFNNLSDSGFYWCQIVVNNVSLHPSPCGYIDTSYCTLLDVICNRRDQPLCAQNISSHLTAHRLSDVSDKNCSLEDSYSIISSKIPIIVSKIDVNRITDDSKLYINNTVMPNSIIIPSRTRVSRVDINSKVDSTSSTNDAIISKGSPVIIITTNTVFNTDSTVKCNFSESGYPCSISVTIAVMLVIIVCLMVLSATFFICKRQKKTGEGQCITYD